MSRLIEYSSAFALLSLGLLCIRTMIILPDLRPAAASLNDSSAHLHTALVGTRPDGTDGLLYQSQAALKAVDVLTREAALTAKTARAVSVTEQANLRQYSASVQSVLDNANSGIKSLTSAADSLNAVIAAVGSSTLPKINSSVEELGGLITDLRPTATAATQALTEAGGTIHDLDKTIVTSNMLLADPELQQIIHNLNLAADNANGTLANTRLVTADVHNLLNPRKPKFWEALAETAAKTVLGSAVGPLFSHFLPTRVDIANPIQVTGAAK